MTANNVGHVDPLELRDSGAGMIMIERILQITEKGYTAEHDDQHTNFELAKAALCYLALCIGNRAAFMNIKMDFWPFTKDYWKPKKRIENLVRAGAFIAAEIDRLKRIPISD